MEAGDAGGRRRSSTPLTRRSAILHAGMERRLGVDPVAVETLPGCLTTGPAGCRTSRHLLLAAGPRRSWRTADRGSAGPTRCAGGKLGTQGPAVVEATTMVLIGH